MFDNTIQIKMFIVLKISFQIIRALFINSLELSIIYLLHRIFITMYNLKCLNLISIMNLFSFEFSIPMSLSSKY